MLTQRYLSYKKLYWKILSDSIGKPKELYKFTQLNTFFSQKCLSNKLSIKNLKLNLHQKLIKKLLFYFSEDSFEKGYQNLYYLCNSVHKYFKHKPPHSHVWQSQTSLKWKYVAFYQSRYFIWPRNHREKSASVVAISFAEMER